MPIPSDYKEIIERLATATDQGKVKWSVVTFGYEVAVLEPRLRIYAGTDDNDLGFVSVTLADQKGKSLDSWYVDVGEQDYDYMYRLVTAAKRHANGIPDRLFAIKNALDHFDTIGDDDIPY